MTIRTSICLYVLALYLVGSASLGVTAEARRRSKSKSSRRRRRGESAGNSELKSMLAEIKALRKELDATKEQLKEVVENQKPFKVDHEKKSVVLQNWNFHVWSPDARNLDGNSRGNIIVGTQSDEQIKRASNSLIVGNDHTVDGNNVVVLGGSSHTVNSPWTRSRPSRAPNSVIIGGWKNTINPQAIAAVLVGGAFHQVKGRFATLVGGNSNSVAGYEDVVVGSRGSHVGNRSNYNVLVGGRNNMVSGYASASMMIGGSRNELAQKDPKLGKVSSGLGNCLIVGGSENKMQAPADGGYHNVIVGGHGNSNTATLSGSMFGGHGNQALSSGIRATVVGGLNNTVDLYGSSITGGAENTISDGVRYWSASFTAMAQQRRCNISSLSPSLSTLSECANIAKFQMHGLGFVYYRSPGRRKDLSSCGDTTCNCYILVNKDKTCPEDMLVEDEDSNYYQIIYHNPAHRRRIGSFIGTANSISGGHRNNIKGAIFGSISGGMGNTILPKGTGSSILGGFANSANKSDSVILGGIQNVDTEAEAKGPYSRRRYEKNAYRYAIIPEFAPKPSEDESISSENDEQPWLPLGQEKHKESVPSAEDIMEEVEKEVEQMQQQTYGGELPGEGN